MLKILSDTAGAVFFQRDLDEMGISAGQEGIEVVDATQEDLAPRASTSAVGGKRVATGVFSFVGREKRGCAGAGEARAYLYDGPELLAAKPASDPPLPAERERGVVSIPLLPEETSGADAGRPIEADRAALPVPPIPHEQIQALLRILNPLSRLDGGVEYLLKVAPVAGLPASDIEAFSRVLGKATHLAQVAESNPTAKNRSTNERASTLSEELAKALCVALSTRLGVIADYLEQTDRKEHRLSIAVLHQERALFICWYRELLEESENALCTAIRYYNDSDSPTPARNRPFDRTVVMRERRAWCDLIELYSKQIPLPEDDSPATYLLVIKRLGALQRKAELMDRVLEARSGDTPSPVPDTIEFDELRDLMSLSAADMEGYATELFRRVSDQYPQRFQDAAAQFRRARSVLERRHMLVSGNSSASAFDIGTIGILKLEERVLFSIAERQKRAGAMEEAKRTDADRAAVLEQIVAAHRSASALDTDGFRTVMNEYRIALAYAQRGAGNFERSARTFSSVGEDIFISHNCDELQVALLLFESLADTLTFRGPRMFEQARVVMDGAKAAWAKVIEELGAQAHASKSFAQLVISAVELQDKIGALQTQIDESDASKDLFAQAVALRDSVKQIIERREESAKAIVRELFSAPEDKEVLEHWIDPQQGMLLEIPYLAVAGDPARTKKQVLEFLRAFTQALQERREILTAREWLRRPPRSTQVFWMGGDPDGGEPAILTTGPSNGPKKVGPN